MADKWSIDPREIKEDYIFKWKDIKKITFVFDTLSCPCPICQKALKRLTDKDNEVK